MRICRHPNTLLAALILSLFPVYTAPGEAALSLGLEPSLQIPVGPSSSDFSMGGTGGLYLQYDLDTAGGPFGRSRFDYSYSPYSGGNSLSLLALAADVGYTLSFSPRFRLDAFAGGGYNFGFKNSSSSDMGSSLYLEGGLGIDLVLSPATGLTLGASLRDYAGLTTSVGISIGTTFFLSGREGRLAQIRSARPLDLELLKGFKVAPPGKGLSIEGVEFSPVYPVFRKYYDDHPLALISVRNNEAVALTGLSVSLYIKEFMDVAKTTAVARIEPGASLRLPVLGLFNEAILGTTEATKAAAELVVDYRLDGSPYRVARIESLRVLDRNAMTWDDDRRAAAFVTSKDPVVLSFSKNVSGLVRDAKVEGLGPNLPAAVALHEALALSGLAYVVDPKSAYSAKSAEQVDFLQFPRQTLEYRGGDCDDLSILNCALLESIGIETAFITVPGHIFMAFALGMKPAEARRAFSSLDDFVQKGDELWVPVEITDIASGFLRAWKQGAKEWRMSSPSGQANFYPVREAWQVYEAVGMPGTAKELPMPSKDILLGSLKRETSSFIESEIKIQGGRIESLLKKNQDERDMRNRMGILFARFGQYDRAAAEFLNATAKRDYAPALVNLGAIAFMQGDCKTARRYYERAEKLDPSNPRILLGIARTAYDLEDKAAASAYFMRAKSLDPALCEPFAYLGEQGGTTLRSADVSSKGNLPWEGEQ